MTLKDVPYIPKMQKGLLSLSSMTENGAEIRFKDQFCKVLIGEELYSFGQNHGKLYKLSLQPTNSSSIGESEKNEKSNEKSLYCGIAVFDI